MDYDGNIMDNTSTLSGTNGLQTFAFQHFNYVTLPAGSHEISIVHSVNDSSKYIMSWSPRLVVINMSSNGLNNNFKIYNITNTSETNVSSTSNQNVLNLTFNDNGEFAVLVSGDMFARGGLGGSNACLNLTLWINTTQYGNQTSCSNAFLQTYNVSFGFFVDNITSGFTNISLQASNSAGSQSWQIIKNVRMIAFDREWEWANFTWQNTSVAAPGSIAWQEFANDSIGNQNVSTLTNFSTQASSQYSNNLTSNPSAYDGSTLSWFNATWNDSTCNSGGGGRCWNVSMLEINYTGTLTNYSMSAAGNTSYYSTVLPAGTFQWRIIANDSANIYNSTPALTFNINKAFPTLILSNNTASVNTSGLVGYWRFEEGSGSTAADSSGNGNTGTLVNMAKTVTSNGSASVDTSQSVFGGASGKFVVANHQYLSIPSSLDWAFGTGNFTVDFLVKFNSLPAVGTEMGLWGQKTDSSNWQSMYIVNNGGGVYGIVYRVSVTGNSDFIYMEGDPAGGLSTNTWYHFAVVRSGTTFYIFYNGTSLNLHPSSSSASIANYTGQLLVGYEYQSGGYLDGWIDELRISNGIARWTSNFTPPTQPYTSDSNTVLLLHMDGANGSTTFPDSSTWAAGMFGNGLSFNGVNNYVNLTSPSILPTKSITVTAWIYLNSNKDYNTIYNSNPESSASGFSWIYIRYNGQIGEQYSNGTNFYALHSNSILSPQNWYFVALSYDTVNNKSYIYINGTLNWQGSVYNISPTVRTNGYIGTYQAKPTSTYVFNGTIDEVQIWNRSLTASEINELYQSSGSSITITGSNCPSEITCNLYQNTTSVSNPNLVFTRSYYYYLYNTSGNANYTTNSILIPVNVTFTYDTVFSILSFAINNFVNSLRSIPRSPQQNLFFSNFISYLRQIPRILIQNIYLNNFNSRVAKFFRTDLQNIFINNFVNYLRSIPRTMLQNLSISNFGRFILTRTANIQNFSVTNFSRILLQRTANILSFSINNILGFLKIFRINSQSLSINNVVFSFSNFSKTLSQSFSITGLISRLNTFRTLTQQLSINNFVSNFQTFFRTLTQNFSLSVLTSFFNIRARFITQNFSLSSISRISIFRTLSQGISVNSFFSTFQQFFMTVIQSFSITSFSSRLVYFPRILSQSLLLSSLETNFSSFYRTLAQSFSIANFSGSIFKILRSVSDSFSINSFSSRILTAFRTVSDSFTFSNTIFKSSLFSRFMTQAISITDQLSRFAEFFRNIIVFLTTFFSLQHIPLYNPANITFSINSTDASNQSNQINVTLYDSVSGLPLNNTQFSGFTTLFSPSSLVNFEFDSDNKNLDILVNNVSMSSLNGTSSRIVVQKTIPQISNFVAYRAYQIELPSNFSNSFTVLKISLADLTGINYNNIQVFQCSDSNYDLNTGICSTTWTVPNQTITVDSTNKFISISVSHFSVYVVGTPIASIPTSTVTVGGNGGGGGGEIVTVSQPSQNVNLAFNPSQIVQRMNPGQTASLMLQITNDQNNSVTVSIALSPEIQNYVTLDKTSVTLLAGSSTFVAVNIRIPTTQVADTVIEGRIVANANGIAYNLPTSLIILSQTQLLLDDQTTINDQYSVFNPGQNILFTIHLFNLGQISRVDVNLTYGIVNSSKIIISQRQELAIETQVLLQKYLTVPKDLAPGSYQVFSLVTYGNTSASATDDFTVTNASTVQIKYSLIVTIVGAVAAIILLVLLFGRTRRKTYYNLPKIKRTLSPDSVSHFATQQNFDRRMILSKIKRQMRRE